MTLFFIILAVYLAICSLKLAQANRALRRALAARARYIEQCEGSIDRLSKANCALVNRLTHEIDPADWWKK